MGIPFAVVPLIRLTGSREVMGEARNIRVTRIGAGAVAAAIVVLNVVLIVLTPLG